MVLSSINRYFLALVAVFFVFQSYAFDSLRTEESGGKYFVIHRVEKGETLYSLSRRYGSAIPDVVKENGIVNNQISLFQELKFPISQPESGVSKMETVVVKEDPITRDHKAEQITHTVAARETLYAISRKYGISIEDLRKWNSLQGNELSIGQQLVVGKGQSQQVVSVKKDEIKNEAIQEDTKENVPEGFQLYFVQSGELLETIAAKFNVRPDSIVIWNDLPNTYLSIGQRLLVKGSINQLVLAKQSNVESLPYGKRKQVKDASGFVKILEEGTARKIEDVKTQKYLVMHRDLPIGTLIEVRNLMNNQKIFARVVGKLPETGLNENVLIRLTPICFERLGVIDPQTRVEVSYYQD